MLNEVYFESFVKIEKLVELEMPKWPTDLLELKEIELDFWQFYAYKCGENFMKKKSAQYIALLKHFARKMHFTTLKTVAIHLFFQFRQN